MLKWRYDLVLDGVIVWSVVQEVSLQGETKAWRAELLEELPPEQRPSPFSAIEHPFGTLEAALAWLGGATVGENPDNGLDDPHRVT
jgi:hypothetical protein